MHKLFFLFIKLKKIEFSSVSVECDTRKKRVSSVSVKCDTRKKPSFECECQV